MQSYLQLSLLHAEQHCLHAFLSSVSLLPAPALSRLPQSEVSVPPMVGTPRGKCHCSLPGASIPLMHGSLFHSLQTGSREGQHAASRRETSAGVGLEPALLITVAVVPQGRKDWATAALGDEGKG